MAELSRRRFLGLAGGTAGAAVGGAVLWSRLVDDQVRAPRPTDGGRPGRVLVVLELSGGNDGLNTLVPDDGQYRDARPNLALPPDDLVALSGESGYALHPGLAPLAPLWAAGRLAALQGIGFDGQTRSHFAATDTWRAGGQAPFTTSWLGRWLDATAGDQASPLRAVALGTNTRILAADRSLSTAVKTPSTFQLMAPRGPGADPDAVVAAFEATAAPLSDDPLFSAAQTAIPATLGAVHVLTQATNGGNTPQLSPDEARYHQASSLLDTAARIIELDVGTEVVVVGAEGYDTHAAQAEPHARLLSDLGEGISRFLAAMEEVGRADDVLLLTTSEFGRRVAENGSGGTDHGAAGTQFLAGAAVRGQIVGAPAFDDLIEGDLPVEVDSRSLFAVGLDWLGGPTDEILNGSFDRFGLL